VITQERDEGYWLAGIGWRSLKPSILKLFNYEVVFSNRAPSSVEQAVESLVTRLSSLAKLSPTKGYGYALSLFSDTASLQKALSVDQQTYFSDDKKISVEPQKIAYQTLSKFLEGSRREALPGSPHRRKVWERLQGVASICRQQSFPATLHISNFDPLFLSCLREYIEENHPADKNLPRTLVGLESYFYEYSYESIDVDENTLSVLIQNNWSSRSDISHQEMLQACLQSLNAINPLAVEALSVKYGLGSVSYLSVKHYLDAKGLSRRQYESRVKTAMNSLQKCIENKIGSDWTVNDYS